jgi:hypothetical protein
MIGFRKDVAEMNEEELKAELISMRERRKVMAVAKREARKKRQSQPNEIDVLLRSLPPEAKEELATLVAKFKEAKEDGC